MYVVVVEGGCVLFYISVVVCVLFENDGNVGCFVGVYKVDVSGRYVVLIGDF